MMRSGQMVVLFFTVFLWTSLSHAGLRSSAVPGGIVIVDIGLADGTPPSAKFNKRKVTIVSKNGSWLAVVGIPLAEKVGEKSLVVTHSGGQKRTHRFKVESKKYPEQRITIKDKGKVDLSKKSLDRVYREKKLIDGFKASWTETQEVNFEFIAPVNGPLSSRFGLKRFFNDKPRRPHSGLDFAVKEGTPIRAPAGAKVVGTGDFFFNGKAVFLEHGQGLISIYGHMSRIDVEQGQTVEQGQIIGAVGKTGRATGAHLHWTVMLNGTVVDPELFLPDLKK